MPNDARLKSLFVLPAVAVSALLFLFSLVMLLLASEQRLGWLGAAMTAAVLPAILAQLMWRPVPRTSEYLPAHVLIMVVGLVLAAQGMYGNFVASWGLYQEVTGAIISAVNPSAVTAPGLVGLFCTVLFLLYLFWFSRFGRHPDARLDVGGKLPEFEVLDLDGNIVKSSELLGAPTVFLFYRGNWCPLCMAQIDEIVERYQQLQELGIVVCLISPQPDDATRELAERHNVDFRFLVDRDNAAAASLGIDIKNGVPLGVPGDYAPDTVMPTMFVTTAGGTIVFSDQTDNYRVRPEPDIFLAILRRAGRLAA